MPCELLPQTVIGGGAGKSCASCMQILHDSNLRYHSIRRRMESIIVQAEPQEVLLQRREDARQRRAAARRARRAHRVRADAAQALLACRRPKPAALDAAAAFELPSKRHFTQYPAAGLLTAGGHPLLTAPHDRTGGWRDMQATMYPSAMGGIDSAQLGTTQGPDYARQYLHVDTNATPLPPAAEPSISVRTPSHPHKLLQHEGCKSLSFNSQRFT